MIEGWPLRVATHADVDMIDSLMKTSMAYGFQIVERVEIRLPDGVTIAGASMTMPIREAPTGAPRRE